MKVRFKSTWFAPGDRVQVDKIRVFKGQRFRRGVVYDIPEEMRPELPSDAEILDHNFRPQDEPSREMTLKEADNSHEKAAADAEQALLEEAEKNREENERRKQERAEILKKARAAKARKKKEREQAQKAKAE